MGTWTVLEAARSIGRCQVVVASSDRVYGDPPGRALHREQSAAGTVAVRRFQKCADLIAAMYSDAYGVPVHRPRCANLFGGGDLHFSRTIPGVIQSTLRGEPFVIRGDGGCARQFLYVEDAVDAYLTLAEALGAASGSPGQAFNFGPATMLHGPGDRRKGVAGHGPLRLAPGRRSAPRATRFASNISSTEKARAASRLEATLCRKDGLRKTVEWYRVRLTAEVGRRAQCSAATSICIGRNQDAFNRLSGRPSLQLFRHPGQRLHAARRGLHEGGDGPRPSGGAVATVRLSGTAVGRDPRTSRPMC